MRHTRQRFDEFPAAGGRSRRHGGEHGPVRGPGGHPHGFGPGPEGFGHDGPGGPRRRGEGRGRGDDRGDRRGEGRGDRRGEGRGDRRGRGEGRGRGGRAQRGDVRTAVLQVIGDEPMHGYQIMQAIAERSGGVWRPSPGAVYPTIAQLQDEGLVTVAEDGGRRQVSVTEAGRVEAERRIADHGDPFDQLAERSGGTDLHGPVHELAMAARQLRATGSTEQLDQALRVLAEARRSLYLILAGEPVGTDQSGSRSDSRSDTEQGPEQ